MAQKTYLVIFALLALIGIAAAQTQSVPSNLQNPLGAFEQWLPIVSIAIFLSIAFAAILYMLGKFLNDQQISARGISEMGQAIGTGIFAVLAIGVLLFFGSFLASSNLLTGSFSHDINNMCANFPSAPLGIVSQNPTALVCSVAMGANSNGADVSSTLNYGLASSYIIVANLTNQAAININSLYVYEGFIGFLSTLTSDPGFCEPAPPAINPLTNCALNPLLDRWVSIDVASNPLKGYNVISAMTRPLEVQAIFIFYMLLTQMIVYFILMNIWPYLLGAGIILRAIPFTRSAGGLLMGISLVIVIMLPLVLIIEYNALGHGVTTSQLAGNSAQIQDNVIYGLNTIGSYSIAWGDGSSDSGTLTHTYPSAGTYTVVASVTQNGNTQSASQDITLPPTSAWPLPADPKPALYLTNPTITGLTVTVCPTGHAGICVPYDSLLPNFYVFPNVEYVINNNGCWPVGGNLAAEEVIDSLKMATLGVGAGFAFGGFVVKAPELTSIGVKCPPVGAIGTALDLMGVYGLMSIVGFILPLLNIFIILSAIKNTSFLFGGDTDIAGLGKLV